jgi:hypothetical protein
LPFTSGNPVQPAFSGSRNRALQHPLPVILKIIWALGHF